MTTAAGVLGEIVARTRVRLEVRRRERPLRQMLAAAREAGTLRPFAGALERAKVAVIAEFKRRSPSRGLIRADLGPGELCRAYERAGAAALSVLTEPEFFGGSLDDLQAAREATRLPALRKDFIIDAYQVHEARAAGADAVLLIVAALGDAELRGLLDAAREAGLDALVEVHDRDELDRAVDAGATLVGVNNRDLRTLEVRLETALVLGSHIPRDVLAVAESGIRSGADLRRLREAGYRAFLVGEHLMAAADPAAELARLIAEAES